MKNKKPVSRVLGDSPSSCLPHSIKWSYGQLMFISRGSLAAKEKGLKLIHSKILSRTVTVLLKTSFIIASINNTFLI